MVREFASGSSLREAKALGSLLQTADHRRRSAQQDLDVVGRLREPFLSHPVNYFFLAPQSSVEMKQHRMCVARTQIGADGRREKKSC